VKLLDFGISAALGNARLTRTGEFKGKLAYVAPEQITRGHAIDFRCDLWALGVVAYEVLTGLCLFAAENEATTLWNVTATEVPSLTTTGRGVAPALARIVDACLQRDPALRPSGAQAVAEAFEEFAGEPDALAKLVHQQAPPIAKAPPRSAPKRRVWVAWGGLSVLTALAVALLVTFSNTSPSTQPSVPRPPATMHEPNSIAQGARPSQVSSETLSPPSNPVPPLLTPAATKRRVPSRAASKPPDLGQPPRALVPNPYTDLLGNPY
jgi:serine/threonine-protein kinase